MGHTPPGLTSFAIFARLGIRTAKLIECMHLRLCCMSGIKCVFAPKRSSQSTHQSILLVHQQRPRQGSARFLGGGSLTCDNDGHSFASSARPSCFDSFFRSAGAGSWACCLAAARGGRVSGTRRLQTASSFFICTPDAGCLHSLTSSTPPPQLRLWATGENSCIGCMEFEHIEDGMVKALSAANEGESGDVTGQVDTCVAGGATIGNVMTGALPRSRGCGT